MKRLTKSSHNKVISGVCGGIAEYLNIDPTLVRIAWLVLAAAAGSGVWIYIVCALVMPTAWAPPGPYNQYFGQQDFSQQDFEQQGQQEQDPFTL